MSRADLGLIGLAVMGENLALNMESKGFTVAVYNRTAERVTNFVEGRAKDKNIIGTYSLEELVASLKKPRKVMLMVKAGQPVDDFIARLIPLLEEGDIIIDGGNSHFPDSIRRTKLVEEHGLLYVGTGVSGGEEGALHGPSLMPGGSPQAWPHIKPIFQAIAAKVEDGSPCADWVGPDGAGHFVKMVHNGIEYGDMQLISEAYFLMRELLGMSAAEIGAVFQSWNQGELESYLIEITAEILARIDEYTSQPLVDVILDEAEQKGTGKWTAQEAMELGVPVPTIAEAVFARSLSALKDERAEAAKLLTGPRGEFAGDKDQLLEDIRRALYLAKICSYAQGFALLKAASDEYNWNLDLGQVALIWRGGCIIRARFLDEIAAAFARKADLTNLLLDPYFREAVGQGQLALRRVAALAADFGVPIPGFGSALFYYDSYRRERLPANLVQAQRDYFGPHTYRRTDMPGVFHTQW